MTIYSHAQGMQKPKILFQLVTKMQGTPIIIIVNFVDKAFILKALCIITYVMQISHYSDWILGNGSKSYIFIFT